jgi:hypothetical protein
MASVTPFCPQIGVRQSLQSAVSISGDITKAKPETLGARFCST